MTVKDWVTLTISILAFIISALTGYWNIIRQVEDLRVVVTGSPFLMFDKGAVKFALTNGNLTFLNLGNRSAAITTAYVTLSQPPRDTVYECGVGHDSEQSWLLSTAAVVVKPGDVSVETATTKMDVVFPVQVRRNVATVHVVVCMTFNAITHDNFAVEKKVLIGEYDVSTNPANDDWKRLRFLRGEAHILFKKRDLAFF